MPCGKPQPRILNGHQAQYQPPLYAELTNIMDEVQGIGAQISGQPYKQYRLNTGVSGDLIQPSALINCCFMCWREMLAGKHKQGFETSTSLDIYWFMLSGDFRCSQVGDVFLLNDPLFGVGQTQVAYQSAENEIGMPANQLNGFALGIHPVLKYPIGGRLDRTIQILRPQTSAGGDGYLDTTVQAAQPVILENGSYSLGDNNQPASNVPAGLMAVKRERNMQIPDVPDGSMKTRFSCYCPPLPGFTLVEGDMVVDSYGGQYRVLNSWPQQVGVVGTQALLEREVSQVGWGL